MNRAQRFSVFMQGVFFGFILGLMLVNGTLEQLLVVAVDIWNDK